MDEGRKRVIGIMAAILASLHMQTADDLFGTPQGSPWTDKLIDASIQWAERILKRIDAVFGKAELCTLMIIGVQTVTSENPIDSKPDAESSEQPNDPAREVALASAQSQAEPAPRHCEVTYNTKRDWIDWGTLGLEAFGLLLLIVYTIATIAIWRANKKAAEATQQSVTNADANFQRDERAWMAFKFMEGSLTLTINKSFLVPTELVNTGKTPAKNVHGNIVVGVFKKGEPLDFTYTPGHANYKVEAGTIFPNGKIVESFEAIKHG